MIFKMSFSSIFFCFTSFFLFLFSKSIHVCYSQQSWVNNNSGSRMTAPSWQPLNTAVQNRPPMRNPQAETKMPAQSTGWNRPPNSTPNQTQNQPQRPVRPQSRQQWQPDLQQPKPWKNQATSQPQVRPPRPDYTPNSSNGQIGPNKWPTKNKSNSQYRPRATNGWNQNTNNSWQPNFNNTRQHRPNFQPGTFRPNSVNNQNQLQPGTYRPPGINRPNLPRPNLQPVGPPRNIGPPPRAGVPRPPMRTTRPIRPNKVPPPPAAQGMNFQQHQNSWNQVRS